MARPGLEVSIALSSHFLAYVLAICSSTADAFHFLSQQHIIDTRVVLFARPRHEIDEEKDELIRQLSNPRYEGGMMRPVVMSAKSEGASSNLMKIDGQDTNLEQMANSNRIWDFNAPRNIAETIMFRPPGMFRPSVEKEHNEISANAMPKPQEESKLVNGEKAIEEKDYQGTQAELKAEEELGQSELVRFGKLAEEPQVIIRADEEFTDGRKTNEDELKSSANLSEGELKIVEETKMNQSEAIKIENEIEEVREYDEIERERGQADLNSNETEQFSLTKLVEEKDMKEIEEISDESKTDADNDVHKIAAATTIDMSSIEEEEAAKLNAIKTMIQKRKEQQARLNQIEEELLVQANEIKNKREELLRLEDELIDAEHSIRNNSNVTGAIQTSETMSVIPHYSPKEYNAFTPEQKMKLKADRAALMNMKQDKVEREQNDKPNKFNRSESANHPILGPVIADLGYKRIHIVSSGRLGTIPTWKKQRIYEFDRVKQMAVDKTEQMHLGFPGVICLHEDATGKLSILDGQHRVGMMQLLRKSRNELKKRQIETKTKIDDDRQWVKHEQYFQNLLVEVYSELAIANATETTEDHDYAKQLFLEINKAKPIS